MGLFLCPPWDTLSRLPVPSTIPKKKSGSGFPEPLENGFPD